MEKFKGILMVSFLMLGLLVAVFLIGKKVTSPKADLSKCEMDGNYCIPSSYAASCLNYTVSASCGDSRVCVTGECPLVQPVTYIPPTSTPMPPYTYPVTTVYPTRVVLSPTPTPFVQPITIVIGSVVIDNNTKMVSVSYSKNFDTCGHMYNTQTMQSLHVLNLFCGSGRQQINVALGDLKVAKGMNVKLCHGDNIDICSQPVVVTEINSIVPSIYVTPTKYPVPTMTPTSAPKPTPIVNNLPVINTTSLPAAFVGQTYSTLIAGSDPDMNEVLTITANGLPSGFNLAKNTNARFIKGISRVEYFLNSPRIKLKEGKYNINFTIRDSKGGTQTKSLTLTIGKPTFLQRLDPRGWF